MLNYAFSTTENVFAVGATTSSAFKRKDNEFPLLAYSQKEVLFMRTLQCCGAMLAYRID